MHIGALVADSYVQFDAVDVLGPFASAWKPWQVALGVIAFWGVIAVELTSLMMKHLPKKVWRVIHLTSYLTFLLTSFHGTFAGTDATNRMYVATSILATTALVMALSYRLLRRPPVRALRSSRDARTA